MQELLGYLKRHHLALVALFVALGGTSYAATHLPANSVGTKQIKSHAVTLSKIATAAQQSLHGARGPRGATGPRGTNGTPGGRGPVGPTGPKGVTGGTSTGNTTITSPAAWIIRSQSCAPSCTNGIGVDSNSTDTTGNGEGTGFHFVNNCSSCGKLTETGAFQTPLLSESTISGTTVKLASVSFCYFVGPYQNPSNTISSVRLNHAWVYEFDEPSPASNTTFPPYSTPALYDAAISTTNKTGGCKTITVGQSFPTTAYLMFRVQAVGKIPYSTGGLLQLGRVTATYSP